MNIFNNLSNIYIPIYNSQNLNTIFLTQEQYNNLILERKKEEFKNNQINQLLQKYLYIQNVDNIDLLNNYSLILKEVHNNYVIVSERNDNIIYKISINKNYEHVYVAKNFFYDAFEAYIPSKDRLCLVYKRTQFTKDEIYKLCENNKNIIYKNENNTLLIDDFNKNNIKDIILLLQMYVPQLPKKLYYNKYNLDEYIKGLYKRIYNEQVSNNGVLTKFFEQIQKTSEFTIFGGIALKYYYKKYNVINKYDFLESNDYDLNISYLKKDKNENYDEITYMNYIIFMIYNINLFYLKKIIDKNIELNVKDENSPYINLYMTFSDKDSMNIYLWFLSQHHIFKLKSYYSNILYINGNEKPYIYKAIFVSNELNSILTLKYIENSIVDVKSILKLEVHNNQKEALELRVNKNYTLIDFIFKNNINMDFSDYDKNDKVYYNNPIFLMLVYIDLIQKYKNNCISVSYRKKLGKEEKDKLRYTFIVKELLIPYIFEKKDYVLNKLFGFINDDTYKNILIVELLKFKCEKNIYNQMNDFYNFLIEKVEFIIHYYFNNETYRFIKINDYKYDIMRYKKLNKLRNKEKNIDENIEIDNVMIYKINDFLRILYDEKNIEYNIINIYAERLNQKILSLECALKKENCELNDKISKLMKLYHNFENIKSNYIGVYEKIIKIKYKSEYVYNQECEIIKKMNLIDEKIKLIEINVEESNKDLIFKEKLTCILKKQYRKYKDEEKKIKIAKNIEKRKLEEIEKAKNQELIRMKEEELRLEKLQNEEELRKIREIEYQKELIIKERNMKIEKYKSNAIYVGLYIPRKIMNIGTYIIVNVKNKTVIYGNHLMYYINWIYRNVSFMTILKIVGLLFMIGIICYGKYLHYLDDQKRLELERAHQSKVQYSRRFNHYNNNYNNNYNFKYKKY